MIQSRAPHDKYPTWMNEHDIDFLQKLEYIVENRNYVLTCNKLAEGEYIECTSRGLCYEDGGFLGHSPIHCLRIFKTKMFAWANNAVWTITEKASLA